MLLEKYKEKLTGNPKISDLMDNWDTLDVPTNFLDLAWCIIYDKEEFNAAPNSWFIKVYYIPNRTFYFLC